MLQVQTRVSLAARLAYICVILQCDMSDDTGWGKEMTTGTKAGTKTTTTRTECGQCAALCCKNLSVRILRPYTRAEIEDLKWQLHFDTVSIYIRKNRWYQLVEGRCIYLGEDDRCKIYPRRPEMCRRHNPPDCEFFGKFYDVLLETPDQMEAYLAERRKKSRR